MKKTILFLSVLAMTLGFVACSNDDDFVEQTEIIQPQAKKMTICANLDDNLTRTALGTGNSVVWSAGDKITLTKIGGSIDANKPVVFTIKDGIGETTATFEGDALDDGTYQAIYGDLLVSASQSYDTQKKIADAPMYAKVNVSSGTADKVTFENLCGLLKLTLKSSLNEAKVHSITIDAGAPVAGQLQVTPYAIEDKRGDLQNIAIGNNSGSNSLVYGCGEGVQLYSTGTDFYMVLPVTRSNGNDNVTSYTKFDIKILFENGSVIKKQLNNTTLSVGRSKITHVTLNINDLGSVESHDLVDLELPSGNKWATMNIGATDATKTGNYYAWGEVAPKGNYVWETYEWGTSATGVTKYTADDNKKMLDLIDDAAAVNWGGNWIMPSQSDWDELLNNCYCEYVDKYDNGTVNASVKGFIFYVPKDGDRGKFGNGTDYYPKETTVGGFMGIGSRKVAATKHIFIPIAGHKDGASVLNDASGNGALYAQYWSSTVDSNGYAYQYQGPSSTKGKIQNLLRRYGLPIRPIIAGPKRTTGN